MKTSTDRILTTHTGSLPRPKPLFDLIVAKERGDKVDEAAFETASAHAVADTVAQQIASGVDIVSDGEMSKLSYTFYVRHRVTGIGLDQGVSDKRKQAMIGADQLEHPEFIERMTAFSQVTFPACLGPVTYSDRGPLTRDIAHLDAAVKAAKPAEAFMTAPSPGTLTRFIIDAHYNDEDAYLGALADAMKVEYQAIVKAGFLLQIDCPDLGSSRNNQYRHLSDEQWLRIAERNVAVLDAATEGLPSDRLRLHICWGNYEGPHTHDIALSKFVHLCLKSRPQAFSFEGANPRHEHEWEDWRSIRIPDDKVLIPGVIDSTTNFVEHPRLVAQRLGRYADIVGRERVIAGVDCGFATVASGAPTVVTSIVWAKLKALADGAALASKNLWR